MSRVNVDIGRIQKKIPSIQQYFPKSIYQAKNMVLLGESTHGTREFYEYRSLITRILLSYGYRYVFFEADWEAIYLLNKYIHGKKQVPTCVKAMLRVDKFPVWMVNNQSICRMLDWMRQYNKTHHFKNLDEGVVFMGLDCYDMYHSWRVVSRFFAQADLPTALKKIYLRLKSQFDHLDLQDTHSYGKVSDASTKTSLDHLKNQLIKIIGIPDWNTLRVVQCLQTLIGADQYFRGLYQDTRAIEKQTWSIRDKHWLSMIQNIEQYQNSRDALTFKGILWAHNSHVGDSRGHHNRAHINIGEYCRKYFGKDQVVLIGFTTYTGTVRAAPRWNRESRVYKIRKPESDTYAYRFHQFVKEFGDQFIIILSKKIKSKLTKLLPVDLEKRKIQDDHHQRAIGVIYRPDTERISHYIQSDIQDRFDVMIYIDHSTALS